MLFLIQYDRASGMVLSKQAFATEQRAQADENRLVLELRSGAAGTGYEIVVLEAHDESALLRTHARFFSSAEALLETSNLTPQLGP